MRKEPLVPILAAAALLCLCTACAQGARFDGERALQDVTVQMRLGPRLPGSSASRQEIAYLSSELRRAGWAV